MVNGFALILFFFNGSWSFVLIFAPFLFWLEIGTEISYSNLASWAEGPEDQGPNHCNFMYKFVNLVFFLKFFFLLSFSIVCRFWIFLFFCYWFYGLASLRLIFKKIPLPTNVYKEILLLDEDFCLKIISSMCYHYSTYVCVCVRVCVYTCFSFDFLIECNKRLFVTVYGVDLGHLF